MKSAENTNYNATNEGNDSGVGRVGIQDEENGGGDQRRFRDCFKGKVAHQGHGNDENRTLPLPTRSHGVIYRHGR